MWSRIKRLVDAAAAGLWSAGLALAGLIRPPRARRWRSSGNQRVLVIAPHPDDEVAGCAGAILLHLLAGDDVTVVFVTDGRRSRALSVPPEAMATHRHAEARAAMDVLGVEDWEWFGFPEGEWNEHAVTARCAAVLARRQPHLLYVPSRVDFHPEHEAVARAVAAALGAGGKARVRIYQIQVPLTRILTNVVAPLDEVWSRTESAFLAYGSQAGSLRSCLRMRRYAARAHGVPGQAEEFWEMSAAAFAALHAAPPARPLVETFRGVRRVSLTDPMAYLVGRAARRRLRVVARGAS